ncbi:MAG: amidase [Nocardioides sp.]|nr:amidase [Nocardioides sp.]
MTTARTHAFTDDALGDLDTVGLVAALQSREVSVVEVVEAAIARVEKVDAVLNAVACPAYDRARVLAAAPRGGWLAGVPTMVKDNVDVAGLPTQDGSDAFRARPARVDGDLARMYLGTGLIELGKTQLSELGLSATAEHPRLGPVRNPWHPSYVAGASSAGAAALVASGALPIAHANDGGGSIRIPASVTGLVGLKPTRDRLAQDRLMRDMPIRIVADGVLTRSVRDTAVFLREAEKIYRALHLPPVGDVHRPGRGRLRIALATSSTNAPASAEVGDLTRQVGRWLEDLGHRVDELGPEQSTPIMSPSFPDDFLLYWAMLAMVVVRTGRRRHGRSWDPTRLDQLTLGLDRHARRNLHRLPTTIARLRRAPRRNAAELWARYDVLLTPTTAHETPRLGHLDPTQDLEVVLERLRAWVSFTPLHNVTGDPAVSLPLVTTAGGLPHGMMFAAAAGREATLLELGLELEEAHPFARITDPAAEPTTEP